jgi:large subunit ribosomal protein L25
MSQRVELNVEARQTGKANSRALRARRMIPAVIYGSIEPQNLAIDESSVVRYNTSAFENALFTLKSKDGKVNSSVALMKEVVVHPVTRKPVHVDLLALDLKKPVRVSVEVKLEGKPAGLAEGGLLNAVTRQVEIECLPTDIPENIVADISHMGVGDALHVSDLKLPASIKMISSLELTVAVVNLFVEEVAAPVAAATDAAAPAAAGAAAPAAAAPAAKKEEKK